MWLYLLLCFVDAKDTIDVFSLQFGDSGKGGGNEKSLPAGTAVGFRCGLLAEMNYLCP